MHLGRTCLAFQLFSAGMFISSTALLPSSFAMYTATAALAAWWEQKFALAIFFTALGSLLGKDFCSEIHKIYVIHNFFPNNSFNF